jgi:hypothetical protein
MQHKRLLAVLLFATLPCAAQTKILLDNFDHKYLDPARWYPVPACYSGAGLEMECVRVIEDEKLRLAHRNFGQRNSDSGSQFGWATAFINHAETVKRVTSDLVVRRIDAVPCAANPGFAGQALIDASFFNGGSGDPNDDVGAQLAFGRSPSDPPGQLVVYAQIFHGNQFGIGFVTLGNSALGTPMTASLAWDQPNHQFLASWTNKTTQVTTATTLPYSFSDIAPAVNPSKILEVSDFPSNCTANQTSVFVDALFGNVYITH